MFSTSFPRERPLPPKALTGKRRKLWTTNRAITSVREHCSRTSQELLMSLQRPT
jgi:hypothetical protein